MKTKASAIKEQMAAGNWQKALSLAARLPRLGGHRAAILDAHCAYAHSAFMSQLGRDIQALRAAGQAALVERFPF